MVERLEKLAIVLVGGSPPGDDDGARAGCEPGACHPHQSSAGKNSSLAGTATVQYDKPNVEPEAGDLVGAEQFQFTGRCNGERNHARAGILVRKQDMGGQMKHRGFAPERVHKIGSIGGLPL